MAVAVATTTNTAWATGSTTLTLNKPSGTADGDFLIAVVACAKTNFASSVSAVPSGWTLVRDSNRSNGSSDTIRINTYYKVASSEGSSWNWTLDDTGSYKAGAVLRITGATAVSSSDDGQADNDGTPTFTGGVTPLSADGLLIMAVGAIEATSSTTVSGYAVTTSNPSWTEVCDLYDGNLPDMHLAVAYAVRTEATATGDWTCTYSAGSVMDTISQLLAIPATLNVSVSPAVIDLTASIQDPVVTGAANVSPAVITMTASIQDPTVTTEGAKWSNQDKSNSTWSNQDKS